MRLAKLRIRPKNVSGAALLTRMHASSGRAPSASPARLIAHHLTLQRRAEREQKKLMEDGTRQMEAAANAIDPKGTSGGGSGGGSEWETVYNLFDSVFEAKQPKYNAQTHAVQMEAIVHYNILRARNHDFVDTDGRFYYLADEMSFPTAYMHYSDRIHDYETLMYVMLPISQTRSTHGHLDFPLLSNGPLAVYSTKLPAQLMKRPSAAVKLEVSWTEVGEPGRAVGLLCISRLSLAQAKARTESILQIVHEWLNAEKKLEDDEKGKSSTTGAASASSAPPPKPPAQASPSDAPS